MIVHDAFYAYTLNDVPGPLLLELELDSLADAEESAVVCSRSSGADFHCCRSHSERSSITFGYSVRAGVSTHT